MTLILCRDPGEVAAEAARLIVESAETAILERGRFALALAGGSTPEAAYALLASPERAGRVDWAKVLLFFGDERFVPADHPDSNFAMAKRTLLNHPAVARASLYPIPTDRPTAARAAADYAERRATGFGVPAGGPPPRFDLILLGMGDDGHTASLFPNMPAVAEERAWAVATPPGTLPPPVERVTLTLPVLNAARSVLFLVTGGKKAPMLREVLQDDPAPARRPASAVRPTDGLLTWVIDEAAGVMLGETVLRAARAPVNAPPRPPEPTR